MGSYQFCNLNVDLKIIYFQYISKNNYDPISTSLGFKCFPVQPSNRGNRPYIFRLDPEKKKFFNRKYPEKTARVPIIRLIYKIFGYLSAQTNKDDIVLFCEKCTTRTSHILDSKYWANKLGRDEKFRKGKYPIRSNW